MTARRAACWAALPILIPLLSARAGAPATVPAEPAKLRAFA
ncbi:hypothetical protein LCGC14_2595960, partial [marine sediment metagenome]